MNNKVNLWTCTQWDVHDIVLTCFMQLSISLHGRILCFSNALFVFESLKADLSDEDIRFSRGKAGSKCWGGLLGPQQAKRRHKKGYTPTFLFLSYSICFSVCMHTESWKQELWGTALHREFSTLTSLFFSYTSHPALSLTVKKQKSLQPHAQKWSIFNFFTTF